MTRELTCATHSLSCSKTLYFLVYLKLKRSFLPHLHPGFPWLIPGATTWQICMSTCVCIFTWTHIFCIAVPIPALPYSKFSQMKKKGKTNSDDPRWTTWTSGVFVSLIWLRRPRVVDLSPPCFQIHKRNDDWDLTLELHLSYADVSGYSPHLNPT